ncbi:hypothetical protein N7481_003556 [Penicillium waksmanii]|uniref:uncharacterized protein n=1 Tax=Penicillium waksmanii TaxID=69791 RepID=UPI0025469226|nr:uncharacterized protein N7481_003556 [Penicillium waksmanii]KAJ5988346.1 hypothetical protein N7481_003556 [Penicillium waksmanii]
MPSISLTEGYTFTNWGQLTTTFTAPASCTTATGNYMIGLNTTAPVMEYAIQCSTLGYGDCIPSGTVSHFTTINDNPKAVYNEAYFSPGLYCPSGWTTKGIAIRDADKSLSSSGVLSSGTRVSMPTFIPQWQNPATLLMDLLDPSETLVMCCPDSMTADLAVGCYSTVSDYKITEGCMREIPATDVGTSTEIIISEESTSRQLINIITGTQPISVTTRTFSPSEASQLVAVSKHILERHPGLSATEIWETAFDELRASKSTKDLVVEYEEFLHPHLAVVASCSNVNNVAMIMGGLNTDDREATMERLAKLRLAEIEESATRREVTLAISKIMEKIKGTVGKALSICHPAAAGWAVACLIIIPITENVEQVNANQDGLS